MRIVAAILLAAGFLSAAPVPKELKKTSDLDALQGEWVITESVTNGRPSPHSHGIRYVVTGNKIRLHRPESVTDTTITLDEKEKTYKWETTWGVWVGRYSIDGKTLVMTGRRGNVLPPDLKPGPTHEYDLLTRATK